MVGILGVSVLAVLGGFLAIAAWIVWPAPSPEIGALTNQQTATKPAEEKTASAPAPIKTAVGKNPEEAPKVNAVQSEPKRGNDQAKPADLKSEAPRPRTKDPLPADKLPVIAARLDSSVFQSDSKLDASDFDDPVREAWRKTFKVDLQAGRRYAFELASTEFTSYLLLENEAHFQLAEDFDPGGKGQARFTYTPTTNSPHLLIVTTVGRGKGAFKLTVREDTVTTPVAKATPPKEPGLVAAGKSVQVKHVSNNGLEVTLTNLPGEKIVGDLIWTPEGDAFFGAHQRRDP